MLSNQIIESFDKFHQIEAQNSGFNSSKEFKDNAIGGQKSLLGSETFSNVDNQNYEPESRNF